MNKSASVRKEQNNFKLEKLTGDNYRNFYFALMMLYQLPNLLNVQ
jgi:hypothetical protein